MKLYKQLTFSAETYISAKQDVNGSQRFSMERRIDPLKKDKSGKKLYPISRVRIFACATICFQANGPTNARRWIMAHMTSLSPWRRIE
jgi:hypothetical protein